MSTPLAPIEKSVGRARRRLFWQALVHRLPVAWAIALALSAAWLAAAPNLTDYVATDYRWVPVGGLVALATLAGGWWAQRSTPTAEQAALEVDTRFGLNERLTTALGLSAPERETPAGQAVMADAAAKVAPLAVGEKFPVRAKWHAGFVPVAAAAVALLAIYPVADIAQVLAGEKPASLTADPLAQKKADADPLAKKKPANKPPELGARTDKSKELKDIEDKVNEMERKFDTDPNRETAEKLKEKVTELTAMEEKVKKFGLEKREKLEKMEQQLQQLDRLNKDPEFQDGPAKKLNDALQKGDLKQAKDEIDQLKKKVKDKSLTKDDVEKLARQLDKMKKRMETLEKNKDREKKLDDLAKKARQEGRDQDAESLERELKQLQKESQEAAEAAQNLKEKFQKAKDSLDKGDFEEAAKELEGAAKSLEGTEAELQDLEDAEQFLQRLKDDKDEACKKCQGGKDGDEFKEGDDADFSEFTNPAAGRRKENKDAKTAGSDERVRGLFDPKGKKTYGGSTKGKAFKTASTGELGPAIQSAAQEAPAAADSQRLPRDAKDTVKEYFEALGGQAPGGNK